MSNLSEDRDAIRDLMARYCLYVDSGQGPEFASLFTDDGVFETGHGDPTVGRDALAQQAESMAGLGMHHMITNHAIDVDGDEADVVCSAMVVAKGSIMMSARTHDHLRRVDGKWLIEHRSFTTDAA
jgi:uncharacterized protein (TIGR02246 family)